MTSERETSSASRVQERFNSAVNFVTAEYITVLNRKRGTRYREFDAVIMFDDPDLYIKVKRKFPELVKKVETLALASRRANVGRRLLGENINAEISKTSVPIKDSEARRLFADTLTARLFSTGKRSIEDLNRESKDLLISIGIKEGVPPKLEDVSLRQIVEVFLKGMVEIE